MKLLFINKFFYPRGGTERVFFEEAELLKSRGHEVGFFAMRHPLNRAFAYSRHFVSQVDYERPMSLGQGLRAAGRLLYSLEARKKLRQLLAVKRFDLAHLHNIHHQLSPSIIDELQARGIPMVMTLHDYKMVCPSYLLLRQGEPCERCAGGAYRHCVSARCTAGSLAKSLLNTLEMYLHHRVLKIYGKVDLFLAPSRFLQDQLKCMGFRGRMAPLPHFIQGANYQPSFTWQEPSLVFLSRLFPEKGLRTLIDAVAGLQVGLRILGEGPLRPELEAVIAARGLTRVRLLGHLQGRALAEAVRGAMFAVFPSQCYENSPISVLEAFAWGKPVVGSRLGSIPELVRDGETGLTFEPGDWRDLREKIRYLAERPDLIKEMGKRARRVVEEEFSPENHYRRLMAAYREVIDLQGTAVN